MLTRVCLWLRAVILRGRLDREMREEMAAHLERATERFMTRGMTRAEARRAAQREFGNVDVLQEEARDARGARWIESMFADLRFGLPFWAHAFLDAHDDRSAGAGHRLQQRAIHADLLDGQHAAAGDCAG
jgi:hypothetical protein